MVTEIRNTAANRPRVYLREWRKKQGLTQEQLAGRLDADKATVSKLENGKQQLTSEWLFGIAEALNVYPEQLYRHPDAPSLDDLVRNAPDPLKKQIFTIVEAILKTGTNG